MYCDIVNVKILNEAQQKTVDEQVETLCDILDNIKDLEPEFSKTVDENFWELL